MEQCCNIWPVKYNFRVAVFIQIYGVVVVFRLAIVLWLSLYHTRLHTAGWGTWWPPETGNISGLCCELLHSAALVLTMCVIDGGLIVRESDWWSIHCYFYLQPSHYHAVTLGTLSTYMLLSLGTSNSCSVLATLCSCERNHRSSVSPWIRRIGPTNFLAGWHNRSLNQASPSFIV